MRHLVPSDAFTIRFLVFSLRQELLRNPFERREKMTPLTQQSAEVLALEALGWLVGNDELLPVFLGSTGAGEAELRARAAEPEFLASVLDFILMDDAWVLGFAENAGQSPEMVLRARAALPGGAAVNWT